MAPRATDLSGLPGVDEWLRLVRRHPLEFSLQYPQDPAYFRERYAAKPVPRVHGGDRRLSLYLHIPFCQSRCDFCNYHTLVGADEALMARYTDALLREFAASAAAWSRATIAGIDIGGGTPTLLPPPLLERLLALVAPHLPAERPPHFASTETTPGRILAAPGTLALLARGVDRLSLGLQAFAGDRGALGRTIDANDNERALRLARDAKFRIINADIIFGLPGQTMAQWETTLRATADLRPDSITAYDCLYSRGGRVFTTRHAPPQRELGRRYDRAHAYLTGAGYHAPYGSLVFTAAPDVPGMSLYFTERFLAGTPYAGFGLGASGMSGAAWYFRAADMESYLTGLQSPDGDRYDSFYQLPPRERFAKLLYYHLHCGIIDPALLRHATGLSLESDYQESLEAALAMELIEARGGCYYLREGRFDRLPELRALFYPIEARRHFVERLLPALERGGIINK